MSQCGGRFVLIYLCSLTPSPVWPKLGICRMLVWFRRTSWGPATVDLLVIRPHWYWTHDLSLISTSFGPTGLTRNRFTTVSDRDLRCRIKGLFTRPSIIRGFLLYQVKRAARDENGHVARSPLSASDMWIGQLCSLATSQLFVWLSKGEDKSFNKAFFFLFQFLIDNSDKNTRIKVHYSTNEYFSLKWHASI